LADIANRGGDKSGSDRAYDRSIDKSPTWLNLTDSETPADRETLFAYLQNRDTSGGPRSSALSPHRTYVSSSSRVAASSLSHHDPRGGIIMMRFRLLFPKRTEDEP
jgi:hypothetical protein